LEIPSELIQKLKSAGTIVFFSGAGILQRAEYQPLEVRMEFGISFVLKSLPTLMPSFEIHSLFGVVQL